MYIWNDYAFLLPILNALHSLKFSKYSDRAFVLQMIRHQAQDELVFVVTLILEPSLTHEMHSSQS